MGNYGTYENSLELIGNIMKASEHAALNEFGKLLMSQVRDDTCDFLTKLLAGKMADKTSHALFVEIQECSENDLNLIKRLLVAAVDASIVQFLYFIEQNQFRLFVKDHNGVESDIVKISDGLAGELYSDEGWIAKFSRFKDRLD